MRAWREYNKIYTALQYMTTFNAIHLVFCHSVHHSKFGENEKAADYSAASPALNTSLLKAHPVEFSRANGGLPQRR